jgi:hypothetical protein
MIVGLSKTGKTTMTNIAVSIAVGKTEWPRILYQNSAKGLFVGA